ncbi:T9SS type A sorting domain-containing protein [uncultured Formosa sp.]|uniref:T9SS type A sorting domain-containing protein n=1 Tax=uncultured Formosa sp. TaxID=255435 RepID=UPI002609B97A|nr:T9SS type A sorting domain-containing protein [uncultured Formosa sp.]
MKKIYYLILFLFTISLTSYSQVSIRSQSFEGTGSWNYTTFPSPAVSGTTWANVTSLGTLTPTDGSTFRGANNPTDDTTADTFEIDLEDVDVSPYSNVEITFDYMYEMDAADTFPEVYYEVYTDGSFYTDGDIFATGTSGSGTISPITIPDAANSVMLIVYIAYDYGRRDPNPSTTVNIGFDNFKLYTTDTFTGLIYTDDTIGWEGDSPSATTSGDDAYINGGTYVISSDVILNDVIIAGGAGIIIEKTGNLTVMGDLITENNLTIESDSDEYGSLIVEGTITGTAYYKRHVGDRSTSDLISAPVTGQTFGDFADANSNIYVSNAASPEIKRFAPFFKNSGTYTDWSTADDAQGLTTLNPAIGFRAASTDNGTFTFSGTVNTTTVSTPVYHFSGANASQWNLIGNPYPSYLSMNDFLEANDEDGPNGVDIFQTARYGIYGYDGIGSDGWLIYNKANTLGDAVLMTPGQGFYIAVDDNLSGTMIFTPSMRRTGSSDDFISGRTNTYNKSNVTLSLSSNDTLYHTNEIYFFDDIASLGYDHGYDTAIYGTNASGFTLYTQLVESNPTSKIGIQSLPNSSLTEEGGITIALGLIAPAATQITLDIKEMTLAENVDVYLEDTEEDVSTLLNDKAYTFTTDKSLSGTGRFYLNVSQKTLSVDDNTIESLQFYTGNKTIKIKGSLDVNTKLTVYDIQGRQINNVVLKNAVNEYSINASAYSSGIYIVRVEDQTGNQTTKRVILK